MADVAENREVWERTWDWPHEGEEWSAAWGGTPLLWYGVLLPRIHPFLPAVRTLEIGPGFGRWTQYLKDQSRELVLVDLSERCIDHCRRRFSATPNISYHVNDGRSLEMVADESIDFAFSFDSLVHADADVLEAYLGQLAGKLSADGVAFLHHSNIGRYRRALGLARRTPEPIRGALIRWGAMIDFHAWRAESVTAEVVAAICHRVGLACVSQETITWERGRWMIDALSLVTRTGSRWERPRERVRNRGFRRQALDLARAYGRYPDSP